MAPQDFKLSAVLHGHTSDVRAVLLPDPSFAITASRDGSTKVWKRISESPPRYDPHESSHGAQFKTCLAYAQPSKEYPDGLIISSGQDTLIEARQPTTTAEGNADGFMVGHSNQVCSLDVSPSGDWLVSGSWDSTAKIWQVGKWETVVDLKEHGATVWAVVVYDKDTIITGCADHGIRIFDIRGKQKNGFDGKDVVRALVKLSRGHPTGADFASASNDGIIRLWTLGGELKGELHGHESFIYSLAVLPSGEIVSSGEDRSVRVWQGTECVQVITLPAISVWSVAASPKGDIIAGSSDKVARIFTRDAERMADEITVSEFDESVQSSAVPQQQIGGINVSDLPGPDFLTRKSGTKEGQHQIIKDSDGTPTLYQWSMSQQTWIKIGAVVDGGSNSNKTTYNGNDYDYVFDIDIEDGKPPLKLPYNVTQNPYEAATKFLQDHELPISYLEETANFIIKNTQGATLGQQSAGSDPWGTENRYRPGESNASSYQPKPLTPKQPLPQKEYLAIVLGKPAQAMEQIKKRNPEYGDTDMAFSSAELDALSQLTQQLQTYNFQSKPSLPSSQELEKATPSLVRAATQWQPPANRLAVLDLMRFAAAALKSLPPPDAYDVDAVAAVLGSGIFEPSSLSSNSKLVMIAIRLFSNMLYGSGKDLIEEHLDSIVESLKPVTGLAKSDNAVAIAYTTFYLNIAIYITSGTGDSAVNAHRGLSIIEELAKLLAAAPAVDHSASAGPTGQSTEPAYRALMALGTIIVGLKRGEINSAARDLLDVPKILEQLKAKKYLDEPRFQAVSGQLQGVLQ